MEKTFDEIIKEINAGLKGDYSTDLKYLEEKCREYKDHEMGREQVSGKTFKPSMKDFEEYSKKYGFPIGADDDVVGLAYNYGKRFLEEKEYEGAKYCLGVAYELTDDENIKKILDTIPVLIDKNE